MKLRWDKFLWCVRLAKTRSTASEILTKGKVKINGEQVKPSKDVKLNDLIYIQRNSAIFIFKVLGFTDKRVGAQLVPNYLLDLTPREEIEKFKLYKESQGSYRKTSGKPTKKDRRELEEFLDNWTLE